MRKLMATLAMAIAVTGGSQASAQALEDALTVTLHVTNYANVSPTELVAAETYATAIYRAAGISTVWTDASWAAGEPGALHLRVLILSAEMTAKKCKDAQLDASVLGLAANEGTTGSGRIAYVFADRIAFTAAQYVGEVPSRARLCNGARSRPSSARRPRPCTDWSHDRRLAATRDTPPDVHAGTNAEHPHARHGDEGHVAPPGLERRLVAIVPLRRLDAAVLLLLLLPYCSNARTR